MLAQQPDNSDANKGNQRTATADRQKKSAADRDLTKKIRSPIVEDRSPSTDTHNVKVMVRNGEVTVKGEDEKGATSKDSAA